MAGNLSTSSSQSSSSRFEEETRAFLQKRLRLLTGVLSLIFWILSAAFVVSLTLEPDRTFIEVVVYFCTKFPNAILFFLLAITTTLYLVLRSRRIPSRWLAALDGISLLALIGPCLVLYALSHTFSFSGFAYVVTFLVLFLLARAVLIPSTTLRTLVLSIPAPIGVFLIQLSYGQSFAFPGVPYRTSHFVDTVIQNQVCLLGAVAVAMVASRVNLTLRRRNFDARHVGQYEIHQPIGAGAMGEVYLATHSLLKRKTALKFLRPEIAGNESLKRFEQEVRLSSRLTHPNNISIYDYGYTAEGVFYYAMELLTGANLREIVEGTGPMPAARAIHVLVQACGALKEAHEKAILHRDIKPTNIMLCEQGGELDVVKILDFGLAKRLDSRSGLVYADGTVAGSIETLAPEALLGKNLGPQSDLYSLSVVAYHLVTGRPLFEASTAKDMIRHHLESEPVPLSQANPAVPSDLESVILQGLSKEPSRRPPDAAAFRHRLLGCSDAGKWDQDKAHAWWEQYEVIERHAVPEGEISTSSIETRVRSQISDSSIETRIQPDGFRGKKALASRGNEKLDDSPREERGQERAEEASNQ